MAVGTFHCLSFVPAALGLLLPATIGSLKRPDELGVAVSDRAESQLPASFLSQFSHGHSVANGGVSGARLPRIQYSRNELARTSLSGRPSFDMANGGIGGDSGGRSPETPPVNRPIARSYHGLQRNLENLAQVSPPHRHAYHETSPHADLATIASEGTRDHRSDRSSSRLTHGHVLRHADVPGASVMLAEQYVARDVTVDYEHDSLQRQDDVRASAEKFEGRGLVQSRQQVWLCK